jgi:mono/diheme cytochrome c family protein
MNSPIKPKFRCLAVYSPGLFILILSAVFLFAPLMVTGSALAQSDLTPEDPPDAEAGLPIHADRCATCHGATGQGDGELAPNLPNPPTAHGSTEFLRTAIPSEMFDTITNGRIPQGMPPFGEDSSDPLDDTQRWDLIATLYSFGTPLESVESGQTLYEENCLACHGEDGQGDGPEANDLASSPGDLSTLNYWFSTSNQAVFDKLADAPTILEHEFELVDDELWSVVDYMRTFSYGYTDALAAFRPLESATISGLVTNGTTGEPVTSGATALLRAFTSDLDITLTESQTVDADGRYKFDLTEVPQEWFFRISVDYDGVDFGSDFGQVTFDEPDLDMPVLVYEKSTDPSILNIRQLHIVLVFDQDRVMVSELYVVGNDSPTVFVGESGSPAGGTFEFSVPEGATDFSVQRGFGSLDSFIPAGEIIETDTGFADTLPVRSGQGTLTLLVQYVMPYDENQTISHPLNYTTTGINLVLPEVGVTLDETDGWISGGQQTMESGTVTTFSKTNVAAEELLTMDLEGSPRSNNAAAGVAIEDNALELVIGLAVAGVVIGGAVFVVRRWQRDAVDDYPSREELIQELADLDDAYEAGEVDEDEYHREREELKAELMAIWEDDDSAQK